MATEEKRLDNRSVRTFRRRGIVVTIVDKRVQYQSVAAKSNHFATTRLQPRPPIPPPGFAKAAREAREAKGDSRASVEIVKDLRKRPAP